MLSYHIWKQSFLNAVIYSFIMAENKLWVTRFRACFTTDSNQSIAFCVALFQLLLFCVNSRQTG